MGGQIVATFQLDKEAATGRNRSEDLREFCDRLATPLVGFPLSNVGRAKL